MKTKIITALTVLSLCVSVLVIENIRMKELISKNFNSESCIAVLSLRQLYDKDDFDLIFIRKMEQSVESMDINFLRKKLRLMNMKGWYEDCTSK